MSSSTRVRHKTGEKATRAGWYEFEEYVRGGRTPAPTADERTLPLDFGDTVPPVKSSDKAAWYVWVRALR